MVRFLLGLGLGYVVGTRAGKERYEQLLRAYQRTADHPAVQGAAGFARATVESAVQNVRKGPDQR